MIDPTSAATLFAPPATPAANRSQMGKDEFLQLLVTQLRHQDPMSPMEPHEFAAQLAQFSSVEQLTQLNDSMSANIAATKTASIIGQTALGASLIGKTVIAEGNQVSIDSAGSGSIRFDAANAGSGHLRLLDENGKIVQESDLGAVAQGPQTMAVPAGLPPGTYHYEVDVTAADGSVTHAATFTTGVVSGLFFQDGAILLRLGELEVPLDTLSEIQPAIANGTTPGASALFTFNRGRIVS
jgi:flagellar basal-body rod modification protein FlgD